MEAHKVKPSFVGVEGGIAPEFVPHLVVFRDVPIIEGVFHTGHVEFVIPHDVFHLLRA
jgi:hypothetical protein